jgi:hypothetical protein
MMGVRWKEVRWEGSEVAGGYFLKIFGKNVLPFE